MNNEVSINLDRVISQLLPETINLGLELCGQTVENEAKERCPVDDGILRASINHKVNEQDKSVTVGSNIEYSLFVHEGTGIYAKNGNGRMTGWVYEDAKGETYFTRGQKPNPFLQDAVDNNLDKFPELFERLLERQGL